tara:strand:- start:1467 stop:1868 length:402 start_codon:yes stop_codon:yes gene_type:complete
MNFKHIKLPSNKKFGIFFSSVFIFIAIFFYVNKSIFLFYIFVALSIIFLIISIFKDNLLYPLNISWMYLGLIIGLIINPIVLGAIFFLLITPIGILSKLFGRDELTLNKTKLKSFWITKKQYKYDHENFKNQY